MRTFIAVELPEEIKSALARLQDKLKESGADVKWVQPQNIHLTLKFLGERDEKRIEKISRILEETAQDQGSFQASISSLGAFPKIESPRIIWVGIDKGQAQIKRIVCELEDKIARLGIPKEDRPFSCHITIARTRCARNRLKLARELENLANAFIKKNLEFPVTKITLFKSTLSAGGPLYEAVKVVNLKKEIASPLRGSQ